MWIGLLAASLLQLGCIDWIEVRPEVLPRLSASSSAQLQRAVETGEEGGVSPSTAVVGTTIENAEGEEVLIRPPYDTRLSTAEGSLEVEGPVAAAIANGNLTVQGPQTERTTVPLSDLERVEVSQFSAVKTYLIVLGLTVAVAAGGLAIIAVD